MSCPPGTWSDCWPVALAILKGLGIQPTTGNVKLLSAWMYTEHAPSTNPPSNVVWNCWVAQDRFAYNPIDSVLVYGGSSPLNRVGVQAYPSAAIGIEATILTLRNTAVYQPVLQALRDSNPIAFFSTATVDWGKISGESGTIYASQLQDNWAHLPNVPESAVSGSSSSGGPKRSPTPHAARRPFPWGWVIVGTIVTGVSVGVGVDWIRHHPATRQNARRWAQNRVFWQ